MPLNVKKTRKNYLPRSVRYRHSIPKTLDKRGFPPKILKINPREKWVSTKSGKSYLYIRYCDLEPREPEQDYDGQTGKKLYYQSKDEQISPILFDVSKNGQIIVTFDGSGIGKWQLRKAPRKIKRKKTLKKFLPKKLLSWHYEKLKEAE